MKTNYLINAIFEFGGGILTWINVKKIIKDKEVKGIYWPIYIFFTLWGLWNLYYYPSVGDMFSFAAGMFLVSGNIVWTVITIYYLRKNK